VALRGAFPPASSVDVRNFIVGGDLHFYENNFTGDITDEFCEWKNLKVLRFDRNDITDVSDEICGLGLTELIGGCDLSCDCCTDADVRN